MYGVVTYGYDTYGKLTKIKRGSTEYNLTYNTWNRPLETKVGTTAGTILLTHELRLRA